MRVGSLPLLPPMSKRARSVSAAWRSSTGVSSTLTASEKLEGRLAGECDALTGELLDFVFLLLRR